eukprot:10566214-Prorocentrum_lima.AAC.1
MSIRYFALVVCCRVGDQTIMGLRDGLWSGCGWRHAGWAGVRTKHTSPKICGRIVKLGSVAP